MRRRTPSTDSPSCQKGDSEHLSHNRYMCWGSALFVAGWLLGMTFQLQLTQLQYVSPGASRACDAAYFCTEFSCAGQAGS